MTVQQIKPEFSLILPCTSQNPETIGGIKYGFIGYIYYVKKVK